MTGSTAARPADAIAFKIGNCLPYTQRLKLLKMSAPMKPRVLSIDSFLLLLLENGFLRRIDLNDWIFAFVWHIFRTTKADHFFANRAALDHHHSTVALIAAAGCIAFDGSDRLAIDASDDSHMLKFDRLRHVESP
jgi:hypothetical protein